MPAMNPPFSGAVVEVSKENVDRYVEGGWRKVSKKEPDQSKSGSKKSKK